MDLKIIYRDEYLIAIDKPHGLLVHRSKYARDAKVFALQELRNQIDQHVYPCHRIDRKTSGVLLFALDENTNSLMQQQFAGTGVEKQYHAIVRGHTPDKGTIDYALINEQGKQQDALTHYVTLKRFEIDVPLGKFNTSRYSLVEVYPQTGRMHQIRKHFAHIFHPIVGDRPHGCNKQNKLFKERWNMISMMLHARKLEFMHPILKKTICLSATYSEEFMETMEILNS
ncbi:pseudouridine synthase [Bacteroidales bacterium]|nr:pseudouridine synthase [Bacteroidales bacterium]